MRRYNVIEKVSECDDICNIILYICVYIFFFEYFWRVKRLLNAHPVRPSVQRELIAEHRATVDLTSYRWCFPTTNDVFYGREKYMWKCLYWV